MYFHIEWQEFVYIIIKYYYKDTAFAFPGGHVELGETNAQTLIREFKEEIGVDITVSDLKWVGEIFFPWENKSCHQICLYYIVDIKSNNVPLEGMFLGKEKIEGRKFDLEFHWVLIGELNNIEVYPTNVVELVNKINDGVQHFIYQEKVV